MARDTCIQLLGLGVSTIDELLLLSHHPRINEKQRILSRTRQCGGLTGSALVAASRLGCVCGYVVSLGRGDLSAFLRTSLESEGIRLFENDDEPGAEPFFSLVLTEEKTGERSIMWDDSLARPPRIGWEELALVRKAKCIFVDHLYAAECVEAAKVARASGVSVVGDFERSTPGGAELIALTDHLIVPCHFARELAGGVADVEKAVSILAAVPGRSLACVTDGVLGAWYALGSKPEQVYHQPVFSMEKIVDTTGCGDVFHGVYAAGLVFGWGPAQRIASASAAAALKTQKVGAQAGAPRMGELRGFLRDSGLTNFCKE